jgi:uncharacterized membrane protein YoaK (UPF0700 family)
MSTAPDLEELERAYRSARFKVILHLLFVTGCSIVALILRRFFRLPPLMLGVVLIVALIVFFGDIMKFLRLRNELQRQRGGR